MIVCVSLQVSLDKIFLLVFIHDLLVNLQNIYDLFITALVKDWLSLIPPAAIVGGLGYTFYLAYCPKGRPIPTARCNNLIRLDEPKVVDAVDIEDIADKAAFCRCWRSKNVCLFVCFNMPVY